MIKDAVWILAAVLAVAAGYTDWRWRRIPNWLTVPGLLLGIGLGTAAAGWTGARDSILGAALALALLLPFVVGRNLGGGDWKLMGAVGAFVGWRDVLTVLAAALLVNGLIAVAMIIQRRRVIKTFRNMGGLFLSCLTFRSPGKEFTLENPDAVKVPFGISAAIAVILYSGEHLWGKR